MTQEQLKAAKTTYGAIISQVRNLSFGEMLMLKACYERGSSFETLPEGLKQRFLAIAVVVRAP